MIVRWDLALNTASFDFYSWLVMAAAKGAREVVFGTEKIKKGRWPEAVIRERFRSILEPGPVLLGLPSRLGSDGIKPHGPNLSELIAFYRNGNTFPRLKSVLPPGKAEYTITLRRNSYRTDRNSNEEAWREFGREIGAVIIEDYDVKPMHLHERMALYAGARMNFGVVTGPMHLIILSEYPMMMFKMAREEAAYNTVGIKTGDTYPWLLPNQHTFWEADLLPNIRRRFKEWLGNQ